MVEQHANFQATTDHGVKCPKSNNKSDTKVDHVVDVTALKNQLKNVEDELSGLGDRRKALEKAAKDIRSAISSVEALDGATKSRSSGSRSTRSKPSKPRPTVTPDDLTGALQELGGSASVEQLVEKLELPDGRSLNGARRVAVDSGTVSYEDRTYTLAG